MKRCSWIEYPTMHPSCGHTRSKAAKVPDTGCTTTAGSPVRGAVNDAEPPTGTALASPMGVPLGLAAVVGVPAVVAELEPVGDEVVGEDVAGALPPEPLPSEGPVVAPDADVVPPAARPNAADSPAATMASAATPAA